MNKKALAYSILISVLGVYILVEEITAFRLDLSHFGLIVLIFTVVSFLAEIYALQVIPRWHLSTGIVIGVSAILIGGPTNGPSLAIWVIFLSNLPAEVLLRWDKIKEDGFRNFLLFISFNISQLIISISLAAYVFQLLGSPESPYTSFQNILFVFVVFGVYQLTNASLVSVVIALISNSKLTYILRYSLKNLPFQLVAMGILAMLLSILYSTSPWNILYGFIPLALVHYSMSSYLKLRQTAHQAFIKISELLEQRDPYTGEHSQDTERWSISLAQALELSDELLEDIQKGAVIHDIGKIAIPDAILLKRGPLNEAEWKIMKTHPVVGAEILSGIEIYKNVVPMVRHEHEHWDGGGYPDGLSGEDIPLGARIIAVADVYSALTTPREYRPSQGKPLKYTAQEACEILTEMAGKVLDPNLVKVFIEKVVSKEEEEKVA